MSEKTAFALGGLGGNNAFGVGFLEAALTQRFKPDMISCTSGQVFWVSKYLEQLPNGSLKPILKEEINKTGWDNPLVRNRNLDLAYLFFWGRSGVYESAWLKYIANAWSNAAIAGTRMCMEGPNTFVAKRILEIFPGSFLTPSFSQDFYQRISHTLSTSEIGIAFNSYDAVQGLEYVYLNTAARKLLNPEGRQGRYGHNDRSTYRERTIYQDITPEGVRRSLWLYFYGPNQDNQWDGAYFRQIILSELSPVKKIYVVRPLHFHWGSSPPQNWPDMEDFKTELGFNSGYAGERGQLQLMNKMLSEPGIPRAMKNKYKPIELVEIEQERNRGFFGYLFEDMRVFENGLRQGLAELPKRRPPPHPARVPAPPNGNDGFTAPEQPVSEWDLVKCASRDVARSAEIMSDVVPKFLSGWVTSFVPPART